MARGWWAIGLVLAGCTEGDLALEALVTSDAPLEQVRERTRVERLGQARLLPDGPPIDEEPVGMPPWGDLAVAAIGERLQVVHEGADATLLVWLDREDLGRWAIDGAWGTALPGQSVDTGVGVAGGTEVEVLERNGGFTAIEVKTYDLTVQAWVPGFEVGPYWIEADEEPDEDGPSWRDFDGWVRAGAEILDAPDGNLLASVAVWGDDPVEVGKGTAALGGLTLDQAAGYTLIELSQGGLTVVGWVLDPDVADRPTGARGGCGGSGFGVGGDWGVWPSLELPAGTPLYAGPDGPFVGETTTARGWAIVAEDVEGYTAIRVPSPWGHATAYVW